MSTFRNLHMTYLQSWKLIICLFACFLITVNISVARTPDSSNTKASITFFDSVLANNLDSESSYVHYLMDREGKPYIVAIKTKDSIIVEMVRSYFNERNQFNIEQDGEWFMISFIYHQLY